MSSTQRAPHPITARDVVFYAMLSLTAAAFIVLGIVSHRAPHRETAAHAHTIEYVTPTPAPSATPATVLAALPTIDSPPTPTPTPTPMPTPDPLPDVVHAASNIADPAAPLHSTRSWTRLSYAEARARWLDLISAYPWDAEEALLVLLCESSGDPLVVSSAGCVGLFQICGSGDPAQYGDPATNVAAAYSKYLDGLAHGNRWYHWNNFGGCGHFD